MKERLRIVALVPARSGSKRLPHKNIAPLTGVPLMAYTIRAAIDSRLFADVVVSTDSEKYAEIARHYGAEVPCLRPSRLAGEKSCDVEWVEHVLNALKARGREYDCFSILRPTSPFRLSTTIRRAWKEFRSHKNIDSIRAVEPCKQHPGKMWVLASSGLLKPLLKQPCSGVPFHSTQYAALPRVYAQNASLEIAWTRVVTSERSISGSRIAPFFTKGFEGVDINEPRDLWLAERLAQKQKAELPTVRSVKRFR